MRRLKNLLFIVAVLASWPAHASMTPIEKIVATSVWHRLSYLKPGTVDCLPPLDPPRMIDSIFINVRLDAIDEMQRTIGTTLPSGLRVYGVVTAQEYTELDDVLGQVKAHFLPEAVINACAQ